MGKKGVCCICNREVNSTTLVGEQGRMCQKHAHQWYEKGKITDPTPFTFYDKNEFIEHDDFYEIILRKPTEGYVVVAKCIIDKDDYGICKDLRWRYNKVKYNNKDNKYIEEVVTGSPCKNNVIPIHRYVMGDPKEMAVDHINGNRLDNRKENLRICSQKDNVKNKTQLLSSNTSGILGVYKDNRHNRLTNWISEIRVDHVKIYLSAYERIEEAVYSRLYAEQLLFGTYSSSNNYDISQKYIKDLDETTKESIKVKILDRIKSRFETKGMEIPQLHYDCVNI